jgi:hypothetical protein
MSCIQTSGDYYLIDFLMAEKWLKIRLCPSGIAQPISNNWIINEQTHNEKMLTTITTTIDRCSGTRQLNRYFTITKRGFFTSHCMNFLFVVKIGNRVIGYIHASFEFLRFMRFQFMLTFIINIYLLNSI